MAFNEKFKYKDAFADIYDVWGRRTPSFEVHYQKEVISILSDYGHGTNKNSEDKAKVLGAGYEVLIMAFFIGLYSNKMLPFEEYADIKDTGQPIQFWGNLDSKTRRRAYPKLREYMFVALVARTPDIDWIALDKGKRTVNEDQRTRHRLGVPADQQRASKQPDRPENTSAETVPAERYPLCYGHRRLRLIRHRQHR